MAPETRTGPARVAAGEEPPVFGQPQRGGPEVPGREGAVGARKKEEEEEEEEVEGEEKQFFLGHVGEWF